MYICRSNNPSHTSLVHSHSFFQFAKTLGAGGTPGRRAALNLGVMFVSFGAIGASLGSSLHPRKGIRHGLSLLQDGLDGIKVLAHGGQVRNGFDLLDECFAAGALVWGKEREEERKWDDVFDYVCL